MFQSFKIKDIITLIAVILIGFGWVLIDQIFLPEASQRFIALVLISLILFLGQFAINKPTAIWKYAKTLALICFIFTVATAIVMHVIINHDFDLKSILICALSAFFPYLSATVYKLFKKNTK